MLTTIWRYISENITENYNDNILELLEQIILRNL